MNHLLVQSLSLGPSETQGRNDHLVVPDDYVEDGDYVVPYDYVEHDDC